ncbi:hypothetical protein Gasu2_23780 [Galdieria sulphuraria]|nr:hypothetical protein Gasu2_23780 [Galdieria sulphuraria]
MCKPCTFLRLLKQPEQSLVVEATKLHVSGEESKLQVNLTELWYSLCKEDKSLTFQDFRNVDPLVPIQPLFSVWNEVLCVVVGDTRALLYLDSLLLFNSSSCPFLLSHVAQHLPKNRTVEWGHEKLHPRIALLEGLLLHSLEALQTAYDYDQLGILRKCSRDLEVLMKKCDSFYNELENVLQDSKLSFWILVEALLEPYLQNIRMIGFDLLGTLLSCVITFVSVFVGYFGFNLTIPIYSASKGSQYYCGLGI